MRKLPPRATVQSVETADPDLAAALLKVSLMPTADNHRAVADEYMRLHIFDTADEYLTTALEIDPHNAMAWDRKARVWRDMGYYMVLYLAGLQTIPPELHEAAQVDGAGPWARFWRITVPALRPTTFFVLIMLTISSFKVFDLVQIMTEGGPGRSTLVLSQLIYREGIREGRFGYASAISMVLFLIVLAITLVQFRIQQRNER